MDKVQVSREQRNTNNGIIGALVSVDISAGGLEDMYKQNLRCV